MLKFKNSVLKRYYIFEWNEENGFWRKFSTKIHIGARQTYL